MNNKRVTYIIHVAIWTLMFLSPLMQSAHDDVMTLHKFVFISAVPLSLLIVFYANYSWLTPKYFATGNKQTYFVINAIMILFVGMALHAWLEMTHPIYEAPLHIREKERPMTLFFVLRNIFNLSISAAIATTIQLATRWQVSENARREAETARTNAELKNLRSQINPHFLLNTLNNIYALTELDTTRAQQAIHELSKLLRHILYDNQQEFVNLKSEIQFLTNYINLMKIRLSPNVDVSFHTSIPEPCNLMVAPLIFISLIENAFKHGVSATQPSYIHISIDADEKTISCFIRNSNYPKGDKDRSGHGIGLKQVADRLELMYHGKYEWKTWIGNEGKEYSSKIIIYDTKVCNN